MTAIAICVSLFGALAFILFKQHRTVPTALPASSAAHYTYEFVECTNKDRQKKLIRKDEGFCCLAAVGGTFGGGGEAAKVEIHGDGYWYVIIESGQQLTWCRVLEARLK